MGILIPEDQAKELMALVRENNRMLKDMRRSAFIGTILQIIWWIIVLVVLPYLTWIFLEPCITAVTEAYSQTQTQSEAATNALAQLQELGKGIDLQSIFDRFVGGSATTTD